MIFIKNILAVDVEDWYHPEYVRNKVKEKFDRILISMDITLKLLKKYNITCTFFIVGEIAEKYPDLVHRISKENHEIAFHSYHHIPLSAMDEFTFRDELSRYDKLINLLNCERPIGYRAPSYSLNNDTIWSLKVLKEMEYLYDASLFPIKTPLYGENNTSISPYFPSFEDLHKSGDNNLLEFPALIYSTYGIKIPMAGGFYLRFFPSLFFKKAIKNVNEKDYPAIVSFHPWELDEKTPKIKIGFRENFVTYYNIKNTKNKLEELFKNFQFGSFKEYIKLNYTEVY